MCAFLADVELLYAWEELVQLNTCVLLVFNYGWVEEACTEGLGLWGLGHCAVDAST